VRRKLIAITSNVTDSGGALSHRDRQTADVDAGSAEINFVSTKFIHKGDD
jgi:hypothetical protein